jgi:ubiquinone/menaquinone biosynthesis C-methylase UbiE
MGIFGLNKFMDIFGSKKTMDIHGDLYWRGMRRGWNLAAQEYETSFVPILMEHTQHCVELLGLSTGERVIDIACGNGVGTFLAAKAVGESGSVVGVDYSHEMIKRADSNAKESAITNVKFERHRMEELNLPGETFDAALCVFGLMYGLPIEKAIREMYRVLRPGGRAAVAVWGRRDRCGFREVFPLVTNYMRFEVCPLFFSLGSPNALSFALEQAGFQSVKEERIDKTWHHSTGDDACRAMFMGGPPAAAYAAVNRRLRRKLDQGYLASLSAYRHGDAYEIPAETVYALAVR